MEKNLKTVYVGHGFGGVTLDANLLKEAEEAVALLEEYGDRWWEIEIRIPIQNENADERLNILVRQKDKAPFAGIYIDAIDGGYSAGWSKNRQYDVRNLPKVLFDRYFLFELTHQSHRTDAGRMLDSVLLEHRDLLFPEIVNYIDYINDGALCKEEYLQQVKEAAEVRDYDGLVAILNQRRKLPLKANLNSDGSEGRRKTVRLSDQFSPAPFDASA